MQIAQDLYEGVEIGGEPVGLITYMRTDSTRLSPEILPEVREYIRERYGREFLPEEPLQYQPKKGSQDAHEAIRPTHLSLPPEKIQKELSKDHFRLYRLIWDRFVACQMKPAQYHRTTMDIQVGEYIFQVSGDILRFLGYLAVYEEGKDEEEGEKEKEERIPSLKEGERLEVKEVAKEQHFTKPPPRFSEATLIKELEAKGIGRPSTYATILSTILEKKYVKKEGGKLYPTELGTIVTDLLVKGFSRVMDVGFTAQMEKELDEVEEGKVEGVEVLQRFYLPFSEELRSAEKNLVSLKGEGLTTDLLCPVCGAPMRLKVGRYGEYLVCEKYPQCKTTRNVKRNEKGEIEMEGEVETGDLCPVCGSPLVQRKGKYGEFVRCKRYPECTYTAKGSSPVVMGSCKKCGGELRVMRTKEGGSRFLGCSRYPDCKYTEPFRTGVLCPKGCGGELVERKGRKGKPFWGCSSYPSCTYTLSREPVPFPCPRCNFPFLTRKDSSTFVCPEPSCGEEFPLETISKV
jgi:DNA topoisomerase-1